MTYISVICETASCSFVAAPLLASRIDRSVDLWATVRTSGRSCFCCIALISHSLVDIFSILILWKLRCCTENVGPAVHCQPVFCTHVGYSSFSLRSWTLQSNLYDSCKHNSVVFSLSYVCIVTQKTSDGSLTLHHWFLSEF
jgi:hypothetical protein